MLRPIQVGFTGTQRGLTDYQIQALIHLLSNLGDARLHHGDCIGADAKAHEIAVELCIPIAIHPPVDPSKRANCVLDPRAGGVIYPAQPYLVRNRAIVTATDQLIACPSVRYEVTRSGTWATIRYARQLRRPHTIIYPDGQVLSVYDAQEAGTR